jgi:hypothetical protein
MVSGQCLCGANRFALESPLELIHHCHCGYCRKHHGTAFATLVGVAAERLEWTRGELISYPSSKGFVRESCALCGTPMPQRIEGLPTFVPAGCLGEFPERPEFHIFAASKAPWYEIADGLPAFDAYPPGVDAEAQATRPAADPPGGVRGSCLCGDVRYVIEGPALAARHCHCGRCRRARGAAHASNLVVAVDALRFTAGASAIRRYKLPEAKYFTQCFCARCGAKAPMVDESRGIVVLPLGGLDDPPPIPPQEHIWTSDIPGWSAIHDSLPQYEGPPPSLRSPRT